MQRLPPLGVSREDLRCPVRAANIVPCGCALAVEKASGGPAPRATRALCRCLEPTYYEITLTNREKYDMVIAKN